MPAMAVKHASEAALKTDGMRVLVERHWPVGKRRDDVAVDLWLREAAPSEALRRCFRRAPRGWDDYVGRYRAEMAQRREKLKLTKNKVVIGCPLCNVTPAAPAPARTQQQQGQQP